MKTHVKILGWLHVVVGTLLTLGCLAHGLFFVLIGQQMNFHSPWASMAS